MHYGQLKRDPRFIASHGGRLHQRSLELPEPACLVCISPSACPHPIMLRTPSLLLRSPDPPTCPPQVAFDPLDGSSIIGANFAVGSIFGVWPGGTLVGSSGRAQVAAAYAVYGPQTLLMWCRPRQGRVCGSRVDTGLGQGSSARLRQPPSTPCPGHAGVWCLP